jgi:hypothetical protein
MTHEAERNLAGYVGLWAKADFVTAFDDFQLSTHTNFSDLFHALRRAE